MNKYTRLSYEFFLRDKEAYRFVEELVMQGKPACVIAEALEEYLDQLNAFMMVAIYHQLSVTPVEATDWKEVAHLLICESQNAPVNDPDPMVAEWDKDFDSFN